MLKRGMRFEAALFDLDGTLVDNMPFHIEAWLAFARKRGLALTAERFEREFAGKLNREIFPVLMERALGDDEVASLAEAKEAAYRALYAPHLEPLPGLVALLERLRSAGVRCAIATAGPPPNRRFVLDSLGIGAHFAAVVGAEQVARGKPAPDLFLAAARALGVEPAACVVFEDAVHGVTAGRAAGAAVVGVTTMMSEAELRAAGARWVVRDYTELPTDLLAALNLAAR